MPPKRIRKAYREEVVDDDDYVDEGAFDDEDDEYVEAKPFGRGGGRGKKAQPQARKTSAQVGRKKVTSDALLTTSVIQDYSRTLTLKPDHNKRPIWVTKDNRIILEAFSPYYLQAYDFLIDIAEPEARPEFIQSYVLTEDSLYAAVAVSRGTDSIIKVLNILCKTNVPIEVEEYIRNCTYTFGKAKLVLKDNNFYIESQYPDVLRELLRNPNISSARVFDLQSTTTTDTATVTAANAANATTTSTAAGDASFMESLAPREDRRNTDFARLEADAEDDDGDDELIGDPASEYALKNYSFMIAQQYVQVCAIYYLEYTVCYVMSTCVLCRVLCCVPCYNILFAVYSTVWLVSMYGCLGTENSPLACCHHVPAIISHQSVMRESAFYI
jgi:DNA excision repair protein ERCC-3